ncbi:MAG: acyltransferase [Lachnospiraceae bacterium]|nr:acyltransferase [Lachnospiraceae bacterium]
MNRVHAFDRIRLIAISCVILLHTVSGVSDTMPFQMTFTQYRVYKCIEALCACGVPFFLMISGALMLDRRRTLSAKELWKKYIRRMLLTILLFGGLFSLMERVTQAGALTPGMIPLALIDALRGRTWAHMWYPYLMVFIYLLTPFLRYFVLHASSVLWKAMLLLLFLLLSVIPFLLQLSGHGGLPRPLNMTVFVFYYLAGFYAQTVLQHIGKQRTVYLLCILAGLVIVYNFVRFRNAPMAYDSPVIVVWSVCLFLILRTVEKPCVVCSRIAPYVFGMYLTHAVLINVLYKMLHVTPLALGGFVLIPVFFAAAFVFAFAASFVLRMIPPLRRYMI